MTLSPAITEPAKLWEIAENLHRLDLTKEQRDAHIRRYIELLEAKRALEVVPQNGEQLPRHPPGRPKSIIQQVADETGLGRGTIRRAAKPPPRPTTRRVIEVPDQLDHDDQIELQLFRRS